MQGDDAKVSCMSAVLKRGYIVVRQHKRVAAVGVKMRLIKATACMRAGTRGGRSCRRT